MNPLLIIVIIFFIMFSILIIGFILMIIICKIKYKLYRKKNHKPSELDKYIKFIYTPEKHKKLLKLMKKLDKHLQDKKVEYWITAGSLLGFMRNGGIIPWDDDIDIAVKEEDIPKIQELLESTEDNSLYKFKDDNSDVFIDVFPVDKKFQYIGKAKLAWPNEYYNNPYPLRREMFHDIEVSVPSETEEYLSRTFGKDWNNIVIQTHSHLHIPVCSVFLHQVFKKKIIITEDMRNIIINMTKKISVK